MQLTFLTLDDFTQELNAQGVSTVRVDALERIPVSYTHLTLPTN